MMYRYQLSRLIFGKRQVLGPNHQRHKKISQHRRNRWDQEKEHHHLPVHGEQLVVGVSLDQVARRRQQLQPDQQREKPANKEEQR